MICIKSQCLQKQNCIDENNPPPDGSCGFMENTVPQPLDWFVEFFSRSPLSHVVIVLYDEKNDPWVYEAFWPFVRKNTWKKFYTKILPGWKKHFWTRRLGGLKEFWWTPTQPISQENLVKMKERANSIIGKPYSLVLNYFFNIKYFWHCSEYVGEVLKAGGIIDTVGGRETPGSVYDKLVDYETRRSNWY